MYLLPASSLKLCVETSDEDTTQDARVCRQTSHMRLDILNQIIHSNMIQCLRASLTNLSRLLRAVQAQISAVHLKAWLAMISPNRPTWWACLGVETALRAHASHSFHLLAKLLWASHGRGPDKFRSRQIDHGIAKTHSHKGKVGNKSTLYIYIYIMFVVVVSKFRGPLSLYIYCTAVCKCCFKEWSQRASSRMLDYIRLSCFSSSGLSLAWNPPPMRQNGMSLVRYLIAN